MDLADWLDRIGRLHPVKWDLGLERVASVASRLDLTAPAPMVFLVGGTNGKGSTCAAISALCAARNLVVGVTTSPHLVRFNERIVVDEAAATDDEICDAFERIEAGRGRTSLTYFEFAALAAMDIFRRRGVDVAVMEIGLGGRLDAMNIVDPDVSVITRIAMDHESWLGDDREAIAREKAGIMRPARPCIIADDNPPQTLGLCARETGAIPFLINSEFGLNGDQVYIHHGSECLTYDVPGQSALPIESVLAALQATAVAGYLPCQADVDALFRDVRLPGRFQQIADPRSTIFDVAHNPDAAAWLASRLAAVKSGNCRAVIGMYRDKDVRAVVATLAPLVDAWYVAEIDDARGAPVELLETCIRQAGGSVVGRYGKVAAAYDQAVDDSAATDMIVVFGSFPIVGGVMEHLGVPV